MVHDEKRLLQCVKGRVTEDFLRESSPEKQRPLKVMEFKIPPKIQIMNKVFGAGYPSLPKQTAEQWYDSVLAPQRRQAANRLENRQSLSREVSEQEKGSSDDEDEVRRLRAWDEFRDDNPKGSGNTYNKG
ncbi:unnamed protein product [Soboliphyme baturini]|uniref:Uncharacterized protein n=1 Tax=Soboliphyme baturini TaxID=241478 RepID=A0A183IR68_9BILA|nr:unnamed protein product [Soboliphyme baturini]